MNTKISIQIAIKLEGLLPSFVVRPYRKHGKENQIRARLKIKNPNIKRLEELRDEVRPLLNRAYDYKETHYSRNRVRDIVLYFNAAKCQDLLEGLKTIKVSDLKKSSIHNHKVFKCPEGCVHRQNNCYNTDLYLDTETFIPNLNIKVWERLKTDKERKKYLRGLNSEPWSIAYANKETLYKLLLKYRRNRRGPFANRVLQVASLLFPKDQINEVLEAFYTSTLIKVGDRVLKDAYSISNPQVCKLIVSLLAEHVKVSVDPENKHCPFMHTILDEEERVRFIGHNIAYDARHIKQTFINNCFEVSLSFQKSNILTLPNTLGIKLIDEDGRIKRTYGFADTFLYHRERLSDEAYKDAVPYSLANLKIEGDVMKFYSYSSNKVEEFSLLTYLDYARKDVSSLLILDLKEELITKTIIELLGLKGAADKRRYITKASSAHWTLRYILALGQCHKERASFEIARRLCLGTKPKKNLTDLEKTLVKWGCFLLTLSPEEWLEQFRFALFQGMIKRQNSIDLKNWVEAFYSIHKLNPPRDLYKLFYDSWLRPKLSEYPEEFFSPNLNPTDRFNLPTVRYFSLYCSNSGGFTFHNINTDSGYECREEESIIALDINSSYPFQMTKGLPAGMPRKEPDPSWINPCKIYRVSVLNDRLNWLKEYSFLGCEFENPDKEGGVIRYSRVALSLTQREFGLNGGCYLHSEFYDIISSMVPQGSIFIEEVWYFERCIEHVPTIKGLYDLRKVCKGTFADTAIKLVLNSSYGKLSQKAYFENRGHFDGAWINVDNEISEFHSNLAGSYITQMGQTQLLTLVKKLVDKGFKVLGGDTDSIKVLVTPKSKENLSKLVNIGEELGQWKIEGEYKAIYYSKEIKKKYLLVPTESYLSKNPKALISGLKFSGIDRKYQKALTSPKNWSTEIESFLASILKRETNVCFKGATLNSIDTQSGSLILYPQDVIINNEKPIDLYCSLSPKRDRLYFHNSNGILVRDIEVNA